jgi:hypothetical protein
VATISSSGPKSDGHEPTSLLVRDRQARLLTLQADGRYELSGSPPCSCLCSVHARRPFPFLGVTFVAAGRRIFSSCAILVVARHAGGLSNRIVFLEDVNEEPYSLDRMLTQLRQTGQLAKARGIVFGEMSNCGTRRELLGVLRERTADLGIPVAFGLPSGHGRGKRTVPLGVRARLDTGRRTLEILESGVSSGRSSSR